MIGIVLRLGGDIIKVVVDGNNLFFYDVSTNMLTTVEGLRFSKSGVIKEFPDLENDENWKLKAIERLKEKVKSYSSENESIEYVKEELVKYGYSPLYKQRKGFRPIMYK